MKTVQTVALAVLMTTGAWGAVTTVGKMTRTTAFVEDPVRFTQSHCSIVGPPTLCGYGVTIMGVSGTAYQIYANMPGYESPTLIALGVIPQEGIISIGAAEVDCDAARRTERIAIWSVASGYITVDVSLF